MMILKTRFCLLQCFTFNAVIIFCSPALQWSAVLSCRFLVSNPDSKSRISVLFESTARSYRWSRALFICFVHHNVHKPLPFGDVIPFFFPLPLPLIFSSFPFWHFVSRRPKWRFACVVVPGFLQLELILCFLFFSCLLFSTMFLLLL